MGSIFNAEDVDEFTIVWDRTIERLKVEFPAEWSITGYKGHQARDGVAWVATLRRDGKIVGHLEDAGRGGSVDVDFYTKPRGAVDYGWDHEVAQAWKDAIAAALPDEKIEPDQMVIEALLQRAGK